jgi:hypothetical protein
MGIEQILQNEIQESKRALDGPIDDTTIDEITQKGLN